MLAGEVDPIHPSTQSKLYTVHLPAAYIGTGITVTEATWTASHGLEVEDESYANPGQPEHDASFDGPLCSVWVSAGTARPGTVGRVTLSFSTSKPEGPLHVEIRIPVTQSGH